MPRLFVAENLQPLLPTQAESRAERPENDVPDHPGSSRTLPGRAGHRIASRRFKGSTASGSLPNRAEKTAWDLFITENEGDEFGCASHALENGWEPKM
jgi:hypothetical protein